MKKRILPILLALILAALLLPTIAMADGTPNNEMGISYSFEQALRDALGTDAPDANAKLKISDCQKLTGVLNLSNKNITEISSGAIAYTSKENLPEVEKERCVGTVWAVSNLARALNNVAELNLSGNSFTVVPSCFLMGSPSIKKVTLPESVIVIGLTPDQNGTQFTDSKGTKYNWGYNSFSHMKALEEINIPDSVEYIADYSFAESVNLVYDIAELPTSLVATGRKIFDMNESVRNTGEIEYDDVKVTGSIIAYLEKNPDVIFGDFVFEATKAYADAQALVEHDWDGIARNSYGVADITGTLVIPDDAVIGNYAFDGWEIESVVIPSSASISESTFVNNENLKSVTVKLDGASDELDVSNLPQDVTVNYDVTGISEDAAANGAMLTTMVKNAAPGSVISLPAGNYDITSTYVGTHGNQRTGSQIVINADNVTIKAQDPNNKPVIYGFSSDPEAIARPNGWYSGQSTITVLSGGVTLQDLVIMPLCGYGTINTNQYQKALEVTNTASEFTMTGCEIAPNTFNHDGQNNMPNKAGLVYFEVSDATVIGNKFGEGAVVATGWKGTTEAEGYHSLNASGNFWGENGIDDIVGKIDGNVTIDTYYVDEAMTEVVQLGGIPVSTSEELVAAISKASDGATIIVAPGEYDGNITFGGKSLTIKAQYPAYKDGVKEADESKLSKFTGTFNTFGDNAGSFNAGQTVVIEGFAFSGDGLKVGNNNYNSVGNLVVRNCTMECGQNIDTGNTSTNTYGALNYFVKISGTAGAPYAKVTVENNYVYGTLAKNPINNVVYSITPIQLWDVQKVVVKNNKIDVTNAPDNQAINISIMAEDADIEVANNYIEGTGYGIFVTTWKLGGNTVNGEATFTGSVSIHDNKMYLVGDGTPIFIGYEEAAGSGNPYGKLGIDATYENYENYNNDEIVLAEISQMPGAPALFYTVTFMDGRNEIRSYLVKADGNGTVKLFTPSKPGYIFMGWKCSDGHTHQPGEVIEVTGNMTFTAIWANMPDITPGTPGGDDEPVVPDFPFTDVREGQWFYEAVKYVYSEGIMNGMDRYTFAPNGSLTRAMVWTMLARLDGVDTEGGATWYSKAQDWAVEAGVSDGTDPMGNITREQLVTMLWRLNGSETTTGSLTGYTDYDKVSDWAGNAMLWATVNGIIEGDEANALNPTAGCTRAQAAAMIMRFCENVELSPTM